MKITIDIDERKKRAATRYGKGKTTRGNTSRKGGYPRWNGQRSKSTAPTKGGAPYEG